MTDRYKSRASTNADNCWSWGHEHYECAVREIEALRADLAESDEIRETLGHILTRTANALKGEPPEGTWHSWHDLPEKATQLAERVQRDEDLLRQALKALKDIRSISYIDSAMNQNPFTLSAVLAEIHHIADTALAKEERQ